MTNEAIRKQIIYLLSKIHNSKDLKAILCIVQRYLLNSKF